MTNKDKADLDRYRARERGEYIDNCYRARLIPSYVDVPQSTEELRAMWTKFINRYN